MIVLYQDVKYIFDVHLKVLAKDVWHCLYVFHKFIIAAPRILIEFAC